MKRMRFVLPFLLLTALSVGQSPIGSDVPPEPNPQLPTSSAVQPDQDNATRAKRITQQAIQALGGQVYLTWRTQTSQGRSYSFHRGEANSLGTLFWRFKQYPDKDRLELTKKRDVFEIFVGDKGYEVTYRGVRNLEDKEELQPYLRRRHYGLDVILREWINQPGVAFFYEGQTVAAQKQTEQVTVMNANNQAVTINFDIQTHLPVRKSFSWRDPTDKERNVEEEIYDNYRNVQGIITPFDVTRTYNGEMSAQSFLTGASYNEDFNPEFFDPQAAAKRKK